MFTSLTCRYCRSAHAELEQIREELTGELSIIYRYFIAPSDSVGVAAALASECAAEQNRFEEFVDVAYERQDELGAASWTALAELAHVPQLAAFDTCMSERRGIAVLQQDAETAAGLGFRGTPSFVINGHLVEGRLPPSRFKAFLEALIQEDVRGR
jgi:protein-disulfide isomerase